MITNAFEKIIVTIEWDNGDETSFDTLEKSSIMDAFESEFGYIKVTTKNQEVNYINLNYVRLLKFK